MLCQILLRSTTLLTQVSSPLMLCLHTSTHTLADKLLRLTLTPCQCKLQLTFTRSILTQLLSLLTKCQESSSFQALKMSTFFQLSPLRRDTRSLT